jgi:hypothetical protein
VSALHRQFFRAALQARDRDHDEQNRSTLDVLSAGFFGRFGITKATAAADAATALRAAGDAMLRAVLFHSDRLVHQLTRAKRRKMQP